MASGVVQFREDEASLAYLREQGINPNEFGREAFERALRRMRAEHAVERLARYKLSSPKPVEDLVREARDEH